MAAGAGYLLLAVAFRPEGLNQTDHAYYNYLADAFLRGQLALAQMPPSTHDLVLYEGQYYLYWPPFPAILLLPFVALLGVGLSDVIVNIVVSALNVALVSLLLVELDRRGVVALAVEKRAWLTLFFAFGTVHVTLSPFGGVWALSQVVAFMMLCLAYLSALSLPGRLAPLAAGIFLAFAVGSRNSILLAGFWVVWQLWNRASDGSLRHRVRDLATAAAPVSIAAALIGAYNYARFGDPMDVGVDYHLMGEFFRSNYEQYGTFSLHYLPANLYYNLVAFPYAALLTEPWTEEFFMGGSLFLLSPLFLLAFPGLWILWRQHGWALAVSIVLGLGPAMLLMGTGFVQFGPRYTLDITVPLLMATAIGASRAPTRLVAWLTLVSIALYLPGTALLGQLYR
jgi:hypothetical protein